MDHYIAWIPNDTYIWTKHSVEYITILPPALHDNGVGGFWIRAKAQ